MIATTHQGSRMVNLLQKFFSALHPMQPFLLTCPCCAAPAVLPLLRCPCCVLLLLCCPCVAPMLPIGLCCCVKQHCMQPETVYLCSNCCPLFTGKQAVLTVSSNSQQWLDGEVCMLYFILLQLLSGGPSQLCNINSTAFLYWCFSLFLMHLKI